MDGMLFDPGEPRGSDPPQNSPGRPRLRLAQRDQVEIRWQSLDQMLDPDHPVRAVWATVCDMDLSDWLKNIKAVEGSVGRDATDPRILVALWVFATVEGIGSSRRLAKLCENHIAFQWLCGGVGVNHNLLSQFRTEGGANWDKLLTQLVGSMMAERLVTLKRVAQDGMRVRANAGKSSFRRKTRLVACLEKARQQVIALKKLVDSPSDEMPARQRKARERAAINRQARIADAIRHCEQLQKQRDESHVKCGKKRPSEARASTTDPEARVMKFANGGYQPGVNVQFATDTASGAIVGTDVTNAGSDLGQLSPMLEQLDERYGKTPDEAAVDGGFVSLDDITKAEREHHCKVYAPLKDEEKQIERGEDPYAPKKRDSEEVAQWRARMGTAESKTIYKLRCQTAEWVNAQCRNHGMQQMPVRGLARCRTIAIVYAIAHNVMLAQRLRAEAARVASLAET